MTPEDMIGRVLYRDELVLVIDKPAGMPVHAGPKGGPNLELYLEALRFGLPETPALGHRLDRDTSGCLALGRRRKALSRLGRLFMAGRVGKTYWAVVKGRPEREEGVIDLPLAKRSKERGWWMQVDPEGRAAVTGYRVLGSDGERSWLELYPKTGRTHQIRIHCAAGLGCPVLGDPVYGGGPGDGMPLQLLARSISLPLYEKKPPVFAEAPPPPHMRSALRSCGWTQAD
ncbi:RNA pseudouridine synthase [Rhodospirillales bacterium YIM 152171]|uniref:RNA pseudouridine synthase n=2 Tax=Marinimicrococcus flavescens TaxID=3031815 RepID=A0AAP3XQZ4_9PROT|nr:RNA pseudouridine synthase [Marinimicrococcus flavescens]